MSQTDLYSILPALVLTVWASILLLVDLFIPKQRKDITALFSALGLLVVGAISLAQPFEKQVGFSGLVSRDGFSNFLTVLFALTGLLGLAVAHGYNRRMGIERGEFYTLLLFSVVGMILMTQAADLIVVFLAIELLSIPLYVLAAFAYPKAESEEAGLKYFLLGAFATGFIVYGVALLFGATGDTSLAHIAQALIDQTVNMPLLLTGAALVFVGFAFKVAAVPFHMWTPDVYQGAPTSVTAFMSAGAKAAGFAAMLRVFAVAFPATSAQLYFGMAFVTAMTLLLGNLTAIAQKDIKRMLAYASIAQGGYILMAFVGFGLSLDVRTTSVAAALFYLVAYTLASFGAWAVVMSLEKADGSGLQIRDFSGLARKNPVMAACMAVFMLSFIGLPPTLGLVGKMYLFGAALSGQQVLLAVAGVLMSLVSAYYYLRVVVNMYMREGDPDIVPDAWLNVTFVATAALTVILSFFPSVLFDWAVRAAQSLF